MRNVLLFIGATIPLLVASSAAKADFTTGLIDVDFRIYDVVSATDRPGRDRFGGRRVGIPS